MPPKRRDAMMRERWARVVVKARAEPHPREAGSHPECTGKPRRSGKRGRFRGDQSQAREGDVSCRRWGRGGDAGEVRRLRRQN